MDKEFQAALTQLMRTADPDWQWCMLGDILDKLAIDISTDKTTEGAIWMPNLKELRI